MKHGNWVPIDARLAKYLPFDREYTELEAMYSLQLNYDKNNDVTVSGLAKSWGWSRKRAARFLKISCVKIIYPKKSGSRWGKLVIDEGQVGLQVRDRLGTGEGQVRVIDNKHLGEERDRLGTGEGQVRDRLGSTINHTHTHTQNQDKNILSTTVDDTQGGLDGLGNDMPIIGDGSEYGDSHKDGHGHHGSSEGSRVTAGDSREIPGRSPSGDCQVRGEDQGAGNQPTEPLGGGRVDVRSDNRINKGAAGKSGDGEHTPQAEGGGPGGSGHLPLLDDVHDDSRPGIVQDDGEHRSDERGRSIDEKGNEGDPRKCEKAKKPKKPKPKIPYEEIIDYLNMRTGKTFRPNTSKTVSLINGRWSEGFRLEDFKAVIDVKSSQWLGDSHMVKFLRPDTLFCGKFEGYLNEVPKRRDNISQVKEQPKQPAINCRSCFGYEGCMYSDDNGRSECALYSPINGKMQGEAIA